MKKFIAILLVSLILLSSLALCSCDQDEVDAKRQEILDKATDNFGALFKEASESSQDDSQEDIDEEQK